MIIVVLGRGILSYAAILKITNFYKLYGNLNKIYRVMSDPWGFPPTELNFFQNLKKIYLYNISIRNGHMGMIFIKIRRFWSISSPIMKNLWVWSFLPKIFKHRQFFYKIEPNLPKMSKIDVIWPKMTLDKYFLVYFCILVHYLGRR